MENMYNNNNNKHISIFTNGNQPQHMTKHCDNQNVFCAEKISNKEHP